MDYINTICQEQGYPIVVENSAAMGNHALAASDIEQGMPILKAIPYAAEVFDNYKKRMCHTCLLYHNRGSFKHRCQDCDQVYYCSEDCKKIAMTENIGAHGKICKALRKLATWNSDRHTKSIIKLLLQILMNHWKERHGYPTAYRVKTSNQLATLEQRETSRHSDDTILAAAMENAILTSTQETSTSPQSPDVTTVASAPAAVDTLGGKVPVMDFTPPEPIENDFYDVLRLQSHFENWDAEDQKDWSRQSSVVLSLLEMAGLTEMTLEKGGPLHTITAVDIKRLVSALESNAFGMFDRTKREICFGRAVYPIASFFNHSCESNATAIQADGSKEEVDGMDVAAVVNAEEIERQGTTRPFSDQGTNTPPTNASTSTEDPSTPEPPLSTIGEVPNNAEDPFKLLIGEFRMVTFYATRDIAQGQAVTISYIDTELPLHARRLALLSDYRFHCSCERCLREEKMTGAKPKSFSNEMGGKNKGKEKKGKGNKGKAKDHDKKSKDQPARN
ncbi:hypothetical protein BGW38_002184 [Lunasporangiospora selenospora]|uniref:MYND-type domain-containing protein n=1 Tax=Lunasporangiospora selenospora TaxID=979761 RepID=A0A9P6FT69_9FUNG|nr:hypothetical protein BGW38_002184 [Lunasporangiospora selenospora]